MRLHCREPDEVNLLLGMNVSAISFCCLVLVGSCCWFSDEFFPFQPWIWRTGGKNCPTSKYPKSSRPLCRRPAPPRRCWTSWPCRCRPKSPPTRRCPVWSKAKSNCNKFASEFWRTSETTNMLGRWRMPARSPSRWTGMTRTSSSTGRRSAKSRRTLWWQVNSVQGREIIRGFGSFRNAFLPSLLFAFENHQCTRCEPYFGTKFDEFKSLYRNILKLLFCGHISLLQTKTTPLRTPPHMGKRYAIWQRSRIGSALVRVRQPICSELSAMATYLFHSSGLKHYSKIHLLTLRVKLGGISQRTPEMEHLPRTAFIRCVWNKLFPITTPFAKKMLLFSFLHFLSAFFHKISSNVPRNMLKIQTESYFHLTMSKWPISTAKL